MQAENDPEAGMKNLGKYHSKDIHQWEGVNVLFVNQRNVHVKSVLMRYSARAKSITLKTP